MALPDLETASEKIAGLMAGKPEILAGYIFGSMATGRTRPNSDVDVAVLLDAEFAQRRPLSYRTDLIVDVGAALEMFDVDVLVLNEAPPALAHNVLANGKMVYQRSKSARVAFQIRNLNEYLDLEPIHQAHLQSLRRRYVKG